MMPSILRAGNYGMTGLIRILLAIVLLGVIAVGIAMWSDTLKIMATANTGNVNIELNGEPVAVDNEPVDYASCIAELENIQDEESVVEENYPDWSSNAGDDDVELSIRITNAYPGYYCKVNNISVMNKGTIPVKILVKFVLPSGAVCTPTIVMGSTVYECDIDGDGDLDLNMWGSFVTTNGTQLHPGGSKTFTVEIHIKQGAPESSSFSLELVLIGIQWNEYPG